MSGARPLTGASSTLTPAGADPRNVAGEALEHLADGPTWIFGAMSRRDAVLAMSRGASARHEEA
jgi:uncharacterized protein